MDKLSRILKLHGVLQGRRTAISMGDLAERLECSPATVKRVIRELKDELRAPVSYDRAQGGYRYDTAGGQPAIELPGAWFGAGELAALVILHEMLARLEPGLLAEALAPLSLGLQEVLTRHGLGLHEAARRVRVLSQHARPPGPAFAFVAQAVLARRQLAFRYTRRTDGAVSERRVCPQRLTRYRGCWYLDGWCHDRKALRSFALERMAAARVLPRRARNVPERELDAHYADAYGIFAGPATETAVLKVAPARAAWVADESWHPRQRGAFQPDGSYELHVPYGRPDELIQDILRLGPDIEVLGPLALRAEVARRLQQASRFYARAAGRGPGPGKPGRGG